MDAKLCFVYQLSHPSLKVMSATKLSRPHNLVIQFGKLPAGTAYLGYLPTNTEHHHPYPVLSVDNHTTIQQQRETFRFTVI
jgi:hypothetical protein